MGALNLFSHALVKNEVTLLKSLYTVIETEICQDQNVNLVSLL